MICGSINLWIQSKLNKTFSSLMKMLILQCIRKGKDSRWDKTILKKDKPWNALIWGLRLITGLYKRRNFTHPKIASIENKISIYKVSFHHRDGWYNKKKMKNKDITVGQNSMGKVEWGTSFKRKQKNLKFQLLIKA